MGTQNGYVDFSINKKVEPRPEQLRSKMAEKKIGVFLKNNTHKEFLNGLILKFQM